MVRMSLLLFSAAVGLAAADYGDPRKGACATGDSE